MSSIKLTRHLFSDVVVVQECEWKCPQAGVDAAVEVADQVPDILLGKSLFVFTLSKIPTLLMLE